MRPVFRFTLALAFSLPTTAVAQDWTSEQQEVIDFAEGCWTTWATEDWATYAQACPMDPDARYWDMNESVPNYGHRSWQRFSEAMWPNMDAPYYEHRPIAVQIFEDVATYYFFATYFNLDNEGVVSTFTQHELAVLQRRDGDWVLIGGAVLVFPQG
jgi:hypothetical protein